MLAHNQESSTIYDDATHFKFDQELKKYNLDNVKKGCKVRAPIYDDGKTALYCPAHPGLGLRNRKNCNKKRLLEDGQP